MTSYPLLRVKSVNGKSNVNLNSMRATRPVTRLMQWVADVLVADVPQADALCEFDCRKTQCTVGEWATCKRRLAQANGELQPEPQGIGARTRAVG